MEAIKINVEVCVNLSESTQNFIKSLLPVAATVTEVPAQKKSVAKKPVDTQATVSAPVPAAPAQTETNVEAVHSAPAAPAVSSATKSIEDVRTLLSKKVNDHRQEIKDKLTELGAPSVTKLDSSKYDEMYNFLMSL